MAEKGSRKGGINPVAIILVVVAIIVVVIVVFTKQEEYIAVKQGTEAPEFSLPDLEGRIHKLSDYRGKVVFLNFWATWCEPCKEEMPSMEALHRALENRPFVIIAVSVDKNKEDIEEFLEEYKISFLILHDRKGRIKELYKTTGVPETFIIDQNCIIAEKVWGPRDWAREENLKTLFGLLGIEDGEIAR